MKRTYTLFKLLIVLTITLYTGVLKAQNFSWAKVGGIEAFAVTTDNNHNTIAVGAYRDVGQFGSFALTLYGLRDCFVAKYNTAGDLLWVKGFGGPQNDLAKATATDASGNIYVAGYFLGTSIKFTSTDSLTQTGAVSIFLAKYSTQGNFMWAKKGVITGTQYSDVPALTVDALGNVIIGGSYSNGISFGTTSVTGGVIDLFLAKFNSNGDISWLKAGNTGSVCHFNAITTDASGNIYGTGKLTADVNWGTGIQVTPDGDQVYVIKFNSSGVMQWMKQEGNAQVAGNTLKLYDSGNGIGLDAAGNVYVAGSLLDTNYIDMSIPAVITRQSGMITKYNNSGVKLWQKTFGGGNEHCVANSLAMDAAGNPYIIGNYQDTMSISGTVFPQSATVNMFIARLTPAGDVTWFKTMGGDFIDFGGDISIDSDGSVVTCGNFEGQASFDTITLTGINAADGFVSRQSNTVVNVRAINNSEATQLYPNPVKNTLFINGPATNVYQIVVTDITGRVLIQQNGLTNKSQLNVSHLSPGHYFIILTTQDMISHKELFMKE